MKKSLQETATITALTHDGRGITTIAGKKTFVSGAIPDEKVLYKVTKKHSRFNEGLVTEVIDASPARVTPKCSHFNVCGGCSMQHMGRDLQLQFKQDLLLQQLHHFGQVKPKNILPPLSGNPWGYRRKARLGVRYVIKKGKLLVGFREKFSNYLADIDHCAVLHPSIGERIPDLARLIMSLTQYQHIAQIEVAVGDHESALIFRHLKPLPDPDIQNLQKFGEETGIHIYLQPDSVTSVYKIWPNDDKNYLTYFLSEYHLEIRFHPLDFTQINGEINPLLINQAIKLLNVQPEDNILDLFCGLGNFTLPLARFAKQVTGIEGSLEMVARAEENATRNAIQNGSFHKANLMEVTQDATWMRSSYNKVLLDPPRTGAKEILPTIANLSPERIVYVSCNPATLARDAGELVNTYGYTLQDVGIVDMFPHTSHIETIALFEKC